MLEVFVLSGPDTGRSAKLRPGDLIGRAEGCALRLGDRSISRRHARLEQRAGVFVLVDTGSTNGLSLDGERLAELELADFLEFHAGEVELRVRLTEDAARTTPPRSTEPTATPPPVEEPTFSFGGGVATTPAASTTEAEDEIELELEYADDAPAPAPANLRAEQRAELLRDLKMAKKGGLLSGDLTQYPAWIQALVGILVLLVGAGLFYGVYQLVLGSRSGG